MAEIRVNPTRMELKKLRTRYDTARRGHKLLKDKRDELMRRFLDVVREDKELRERVEAKLSKVYGSFSSANAVTSPKILTESLIVPKREGQLSVDYKNMMSVIVPVFDLIRVAFSRLLAGEPMFHADQRHIHHILIRCGLTMRQTLIVILVLVVAFILGNLFLNDMQVPMTIIFFLDVSLYLLFFVVAYSIIHRKEALIKLLSEE